MAGVVERAWFEHWCDPAEFYSKADEGLEVYFEEERVPPQYLREAYVVGAFGRIWGENLGHCEVRLMPEGQFPDAELTAEGAGAPLGFEVTTADTKDRPMFRIWRELRAIYQRGEALPIEDIKSRRQSAQEAIPRICAQKADHYAPAGGRVAANLLIYVNAGPVLSAPEMARLTEPWKDRFQSIWLLCAQDAVGTWPTQQVLRGTEAL